MKILVTGAKGFIGKNLTLALKQLMNGNDKTRPNIKIEEVYEFDINDDQSLLGEYCRKCDFIFNLAGVNRPNDVKDFDINCNFLNELLNEIKKYNNIVPVMLSSSIQATRDNDYGRSKKNAEELLIKYGKENNIKTFIYRFPNVFGKWSKPNYNSAVATFANNIANDLPIKVNNPETELELVYIDDIIDEMLNVLEDKENRAGDICYVKVSYKKTLKEIVDLLYLFSNQPETLMMPNIYNNSFEKKLYSTYLSYLPKEKIAYELHCKEDLRGSFAEFIKTESNGQFSINITKPGAIKGQHWHHSKWEYFLVVSGHGLIQERKIGSDEKIEFEVSGNKLTAVHMLPGYTHNIINLSNTDNLVTLMWANELFDKDKPDTFFEEV